MMKKQEFVPRKISEKPLYELKSVEDIPVSELYQVKINGKEQRVYHTEFFDFVSFLDENEKAEVEVTVNEPFQKAVIRPAAAQRPFEEEGNKISISLPVRRWCISLSQNNNPGHCSCDYPYEGMDVFEWFELQQCEDDKSDQDGGIVE